MHRRSVAAPFCMELKRCTGLWKQDELRLGRMKCMCSIAQRWRSAVCLQIFIDTLFISIEVMDDDICV